jgi:hypothetical protein
MGMSPLAKLSAFLATAALLVGAGAGTSLASSAGGSQAAAVRQTTVEFVRDIYTTPNPKQICSLLSPATIHKYGGSQKTCVAAFTFILAFSQGIVGSNPKAQAYTQRCFSAAQASILTAPVIIKGATASITFHPQGVPAQQKFGNVTVSCSGGTAHLVRVAQKWLISSAPGQ